MAATGAAPLALPTPITSCPYTITKAGQYTLDTPTCSGIVVDHTEVELDLQGNTVLGPGCSVDSRSVGIAVLASAAKVQVVNGRVEGFGTGIEILGHRNHVSAVELTKNCTGIALRNAASRNQLDSNSVVQNQVEGVILSLGSNNNRIEYNVIRENIDTVANTGGGIVLITADSNLIAFNTISRNGRLGVFLETSGGPLPGSNNNTIANNVVDSSMQSGIYVSTGTSNVITGNRVRRNDSGIVLAGGAGRADSNIVHGNTTANNAGFDRFDGNLSPPCALNMWTDNRPRTATVNQPCVH